MVRKGLAKVEKFLWNLLRTILTGDNSFVEEQ